MDIVESCIVCDNKKLQHLPAVVAPFVSNRVWNIGPFRTYLDHCPSCDFYFYHVRLNDNENARLYRDYRGREYAEQRHRYEHFYTHDLNDLIENSKIQLRNRKGNIAEILKQHMFFDHVSAVLDYGGDHGQYIIDELADASKYVYEVSEAVPDMGVCKLESVDECLLHDYDLIMCCQVLEHVAYPRKVLDDIKAMSGNDTVLYLEVPYESPNRAGKTRRWGRNLKMLFDNPLVIIDVAKLVYGPRYTMHEHVNYFTPMSVQRLLEKTGFNVQAIYLKTIDCGWTVTDNICCVAKTSR